MLEKIIHPMGRRRSRTADAKTRTDCFESAGGVVVKLKVAGLPGDAVPEVDVGFVPYFEVPLRYLVDSIAIYEVLGEVGHEIVPSLHALRRGDVRLLPEGVECIGGEG